MLVISCIVTCNWSLH